MPKTWADLRDTFLGICDHVYFQPPTNTHLDYPCITFNKTRARDYWANNALYEPIECYEVTLIDKNPDSKLFNQIRVLPYCSFDRSFRSDNLNHFTFTIYNR